MDGRADREFLLRLVGMIAVCTVIFTTSFVGIFGALTGEITGFEDRIPFYLLLGAVAFVGTIVLLEMSGADGRTIIVSSVVVAVLAFIALALAIEGLLFAIEHPGEVLAQRLIVYFLAAALIATGLGYWSLKHWREFTRSPPDTL